jgi:serine/threonine protein kinase
MSWIREPNAEPIPGYRLIEPIGSGGFGEVWKCEAPGGLYKAIKFVYGNLKSDDIDGVRAEQENRALQRIREVRHAYILSLERIEEVGGELIIVMELADKNLHDVYVEYQATGGRGIPRDKLLRYMQEAAEALDWLNEKYNLQHLDVKPRNLFVVSDHVKVADFGLVKHLGGQSGIQSGVTPLYAPPETFNGKISPQSDQYSLAIVFQELLTGIRPFSGKNVRQLALQHLQGEPDLRPLSEVERPVVARALSKDPDARYANCVASSAPCEKPSSPCGRRRSKRPNKSSYRIKNPDRLPRLPSRRTRPFPPPMRLTWRGRRQSTPWKPPIRLAPSSKSSTRSAAYSEVRKTWATRPVASTASRTSCRWRCRSWE